MGTDSLSKRHIICFMVLSLFLTLAHTADGQSAPRVIRFSLSNSVTQPVVVKKEGDDVIAVPHVTGVPKPNITFYRDGVPLDSTGAVPGILKIDNVYKNNTGLYWLVANNSVGAVISNKMRLSVYYVNPWTDSGTVEKRPVDSGNALMLDVPPLDAIPLPDETLLTWKYAPSPLSTSQSEVSADENVYITTRLQLIVLDVPIYYNGRIFQAVYNNYFIQHNSSSKKFELEVTDSGRESTVAPSFVLSLPNESFVEQYRPLVLECVVNAKPTAIIAWWRIPAGGGARTPVSGFLSNHGRRNTINNVVDGDKYECESGTGSELIVSTTTVSVTTLLFSQRLNGIYNADLGSRQHLPCSVVSNPPAKITWYKNAVQIVLQDRMVVSSNGTLTIQGAQLSDAGVYQCIAESGDKSISDQTYFKLNSFPPAISQRPENLTLFSGGGASISCQVNGQPIPSVFWTFKRSSINSQTEQLSNGGRFTITSDSLHISSTTWVDSGSYNCKANNSLGNAQASATITVYNRTSIIPRQYPIEEQKSAAVTRSCRLDKDSRITAEVLWFRNNVPITTDSYRRLDDNNQTLRFIALRSLFDQGVFTCRVYSDAGNDTQSYNITIVEVPYRPDTSAALSAVRRTITITWSPPFNGNRLITHYIIRSRETSSSSDFEILTSSVSADRRSFDADNLKPSKTYEFVVTAVNSIGEGQTSPPTTAVRIPPEAPSAAPQVDNLIALTQRAVQVTFRPPPRENWNSERLYGYKVEHRAAVNNEPLGVIIYNTSSEGTIRVNIENLLAYTEYWVRVAAFNEVPTDSPIYSNLRKVSTDEGQPQSPPEFQSATAVSSTKCELVWKAPDPRTINGRPKGYRLKVHKGEEQEVFVTKTVNVTQNPLERVEIGGLHKYTFYRVTVSLFTGGGESPAASKNCTTKQDTPEAVSALTIPDRYRLHSNLTVNWHPPAIINGILKYYIATISEGGRIMGDVYNITQPITNLTISGLSSNTEYTISVSAATIVGLGPSRTVTGSTRPPPQRPDKPTDVTVSNIESRSVVLKFTAGHDGEAPVTSWVVKYKHTQGMNWTVIDEIKVTVPELTELPINNLRPYNDYYFQIIAKNVAGPSNASDSTELITTDMAPPDGPPTNVSMRPQNHSTLIIKWEPLNLSSFNGKSPGYNIRYQSEYSSEWHSAPVTNPMSRFYILDKLDPYTTYTLQIRSVNSKFPSDRSNPTISRTIEDVPSQAPTSISTQSLQPSHINVAWSAVPPQFANGLVLGYSVLYKPDGSNDDDMESISTEALSVDITGLVGNTKYSIQVLAYTRIGDGVRSQPQLTVTKAGVPSRPRSLSVQNIQSTSFTLSWLPPLNPNSASAVKYILGYRRTDGGGENSMVTDLSSNSYDVDDITANTEYRYELKAVNSEGAGLVTLLIFTSSDPGGHGKPDIPRDFEIKLTQSKSVALQWKTPSSNGLPIRNYTLLYRSETNVYTTSDAYIAGDAEQFILSNLSPDTKYYFKLAAVNDKGRSEETNERWDRTSTEKPSQPPVNLQVIPKTETSLNISWEAADSNTWNGRLTNTRIWYTIYRADAKQALDTYIHKDILFPISTSMLGGLEARNLYAIMLSSVNSDGYSVPSQPTIIYVGVAVPVGMPSEISSAMVSDKEITVSWKAVSDEEINGQLLGYKVYYEVIGDPAARKKRALSAKADYDLVGPEETSHTLSNLQIFKQYQISVTAYNIAGEGPRSPVISATTDQGLSGPPANLSVAEMTLISVNVTWETPVDANGNIVRYLIMYYPHDAKPDETGVMSSTSLYVTHPTTFIEIHKIVPNTTYNFTVQAMTIKGAGEPFSVSYTTGPKPGVPSAPSKAEYSIEDNGVMIKWTVGEPGAGPVEGYVIEGLNDEWKFLLREVDGSVVKVLLSNAQLNDVSYTRYRVSLFNKFGLGEDKEADKTIPIHKTWWFLVIIGLAALVIVITVTAVLCCYCYRTRAKLAEEAYEQDVIGADTEYNTYEMRQSFKRENRRASNKYRAEPPRPSPGAVLYSADEDPPIYDDSSITEKGEMSSDEDETKGNASVTDSSDDDIDKAGASSVAPSYNNYQYGGYNHYVQSGAVQQSWQNSFGRGRNQPSMYAYTDSEAESSLAPSTSHYRSTNGLLHHPNPRNGTGSRQNHMHSSPDVAGSRTPLPNFSSFV